jgi:hypothetical protein
MGDGRVATTTAIKDLNGNMLLILRADALFATWKTIKQLRKRRVALKLAQR